MYKQSEINIVLFLYCAMAVPSTLPKGSIWGKETMITSAFIFVASSWSSPWGEGTECYNYDNETAVVLFNQFFQRFKQPVNVIFSYMQVWRKSKGGSSLADVDFPA